MSQSHPRPNLTLEDRTESLMDWARDHARALAIGGIAVVAAGGLFFAYRQMSARTDAMAERAFYQAQAPAAAGNLPLAQSELEKVLVRFGGTKAATQAGMVLAQTFYQQGKYAEGLDVLDKVAADADRTFRPAILALRAAGLEGQQKLKEAADAYLQAASAASGDTERSLYRSEAARVLTVAGERERAIEIWSELAADESSPYATEARVRLGELRAQSAA